MGNLQLIDLENVFSEMDMWEEYMYFYRHCHPSGDVRMVLSKFASFLSDMANPDSAEDAQRVWEVENLLHIARQQARARQILGEWKIFSV